MGLIHIHAKVVSVYETPPNTACSNCLACQGDCWSVCDEKARENYALVAQRQAWLLFGRDAHIDSTISCHVLFLSV